MDFQPYIRQLEASNWSPETIKAYRSDLAFFAQFLKERGLRITQATPSVIAGYVENLKTRSNPRFGRVGLSEASINRRIASVSGYFNFLRATSNPKLKNPTLVVMRRKRKQQQPDHTSKAVDDVSLSTLLSGITNTRDRAIISLFVASGLRLSELHQLNIDAIQEVEENLDNGSTRIWGTGKVVGKGSKERQFFFDDVTVAAIKQYLETRKDQDPALFLSERKQRLSKRAIQEVLETWCARLGLKRFHVHQCRHAFATRCANAHMEAMVLKDLLGHSRFDTTTRYFKLSEETKARQYFAAMEYHKQ